MFRKLGKYRLPYSYLMALLAIVFAHKPLIYYGLILIAIGTAIRFWAAGHIEKNRQLSQSGPYAFTRNPLYLGSFLGALGAFILGNEFLLALIMVVTFALFYGSVIASEEEYLSGVYGEEFTNYKRSVPVFLPRPTPRKSTSEGKFSWAQAVLNNEHRYSATSLIVPVLIIIVAYLRR